jgi:hypothetical protein
VLHLIDSIIITLGLCFLIEQFFYWVKGSYPYRYGFVVQTISLSGFDIKYWDSMKGKTKGLDIKTRFDKNEVYLKYKYPPLMMGPLLFIGQIKGVNSDGNLYIRVGPLSAMFILFLLIYPLLSSEIFADPMFELLNILVLVLLISYSYFKLLNPINRIILDSPSK